jgi:hypothetical protein
LSRVSTPLLQILKWIFLKIRVKVRCGLIKSEMFCGLEFQTGSYWKENTRGEKYFQSTYYYNIYYGEKKRFVFRQT